MGKCQPHDIHDDLDRLQCPQRLLRTTPATTVTVIRTSLSGDSPRSVLTPDIIETFPSATRG